MKTDVNTKAGIILPSNVIKPVISISTEKGIPSAVRLRLALLKNQRYRSGTISFSCEGWNDSTRYCAFRTHISVNQPHSYPDLNSVRQSDL
jgi:hypothetical protein